MKKRQKQKPTFVEAQQSELEPEEEWPTLKDASLWNVKTITSLSIIATVKRQQLSILFDSRASVNFINTQQAKRMKVYTSTPNKLLRVMIPYRDQAEANEISKGLLFTV